MKSISGPSTIVCYFAERFGVVLHTVLPELGIPSLPSILAIPAIGSALSRMGGQTNPG